MKQLLLCLLVLLTWIVCVEHLAVAIPPRAVRGLLPESGGTWIPKATLGINQLIVEGSDFQRGAQAGRAVSALILAQEQALERALERLFPRYLNRIAAIPLKRFYWGIDQYFGEEALEEIYGVSRFASNSFDSLADPFTRQIAYHGLHEVGQMMVDRGGIMGCTLLAVPHQGSWLVGRNFDFEGGRIFDTEKIMKWAFPEKGFPYVTISWAGMVGVVSAVNENGVFGFINSAGSEDLRRYGTPSTLVLLKAIQFSRSAEEAVKIIEDSTMFITDIFVIGDGTRLFRLEKSPRRFATREETGPVAIANHLIEPLWKGDKTNDFRRDGLTSQARLTRAEQLLNKGTRNETEMLSHLRDRSDSEGKPLPLGTRRAIDALIATHSIVYNGARRVLYVSRGPSLVGEFVGFDLKRSFAKRTPIVTGSLPADPELSEEIYGQVKESRK